MEKPNAPFDLLQWLSKDAAEALIAAARTRHVPAGGRIYSQSDMGEEMFRVKSGSVRLSVTSAEGRELLFLLFGPGDSFGTSSVVDREPRPQTAEAFVDVELQVFDRATINHLRKDFPEINDAMLKLLSRHMRLLSDYYIGASLDQASCRLAQRILAIADTFGVPCKGGIALSTPLSQSELALMIGSARQTINRILQEFQNNGWLCMRGGEIILTNLPEMRAVAKKGAQVRGYLHS